MSDSDQRLGPNPHNPTASYPVASGKDARPVILSFVTDIPNIITLFGLSSGVLGIYFALLGNFPAAMIAMLWAVLFDWYDGPAARRIQGRSDTSKSYGAKLDSLVDIVSLAICPAIILLSYGNFSLWFYPGALAIVMAGVVRLAYFDTFGVDNDGTIAGLSLDITPLILALVFLLNGVLSHDAFVVLIYVVIVTLSFLHVAPFRMRKMTGVWYPVVTVYVLILTIVYTWILSG
jgi:archaetidylserine synthase